MGSKKKKKKGKTEEPTSLKEALDKEAAGFFSRLPKGIRRLLVIGAFLCGICAYFSGGVGAVKVFLSSQISIEPIQVKEANIIEDTNNNEITDEEKALLLNSEEYVSDTTSPELEYADDKIEALAEYDSWFQSDLELKSYSVLMSVNYDDLIAECTEGFNSVIKEREDDVTLESRMPREYVSKIISANEIYGDFENRQEYLDYDEKIHTIGNAADERTDAIDLYRQDSNERIIANYYAKCALAARDEQVGTEFAYYQTAIDYYFDAYAVSCKADTGNIKALNYAATCYHNIGTLKSVDSKIREESFLYSIALFQLYLQKGAEDRLVTQLNIARAYTLLCELAEEHNDENEDRLQFFYFDEAYELYQDMLKNPNCVKLKATVYDELTNLSRIALEKIDEQDYYEPYTKAKMREANGRFTKGKNYSF